jgi:hypothetical protein
VLGVGNLRTRRLGRRRRRRKFSIAGMACGNKLRTLPVLSAHHRALRGGQEQIAQA